MKGLLFFETMITPKIITLMYWFFLAILVITGIGSMFFGGENAIANFFTALLGILVSALMIRIGCELTLVLFKIHEALQAMRPQ